MYAMCAKEFSAIMAADDFCEMDLASVEQIIPQLFDEFGVFSNAHIGIVDIVGGSPLFLAEDLLNSLWSGF